MSFNGKHQMGWRITAATIALGLAVSAGCGLLAILEPPPPVADASQVDPVLEATAGAKAVVIGDINLDGWDDLVSIHDESQPVQLHLFNPTNSTYGFETIAGLGPIGRARRVILADLNIDGLLDIVLLIGDTGITETQNSQEQGAIVLLLQETNPATPQEWTQVDGFSNCFNDNTCGEDTPGRDLLFESTDAGLVDVAVADFTNDGFPDLAVTSNESEVNFVYLIVNPGAGLITNPDAWRRSILEGIAPGISELESADLDCDGKVDLIVGAPESETLNIHWLRNTIDLNNSGGGGGSQDDPFPRFKSDQVDPLLEATAGAAAVYMGDINGDGITDAVTVSDESQPVQLHLRRSNVLDDGFDTVSIAGGGPIGRPNDVELADINNDGRMDIVVLVNDTGFVPAEQPLYCDDSADFPDKQGALVFLLQGDDPVDPNEWTQVDATNRVSDTINCRAVAPIYLTDNGCHLFFGTNETGVTDMVVDDFNNDGLPDVALISNEPDEENCSTKFVFLFENPGVNNVIDPAEWVKEPIDSDVIDYQRLDKDDVDNDGDVDVISTTPEIKTFTLRWLRNPTNGDNDDWGRVFIGQQEGGGDFVDIGDVDGDGNDDIGVASIDESLVQWFRHPGQSLVALGAQQVPWNVFNIGLVTGEINQIRLVDLDGDDLLDAFVSASGSAFGYRRGDDVQDFWTGFDILTATGEAVIGRVGFMEVNGDDLVDFIAPINRPGLINDEFLIFQSTTEAADPNDPAADNPAADILPWARFQLGQQDGGADFIQVGDINRDGAPDVVAASIRDGLVQWFRNPGCGGVQTPIGGPWNVFTILEFSDDLRFNDDEPVGEIEINQMQLADLNADSLPDVFVAGNGVAFELRRLADVHDIWGWAPLFVTAQTTVIGTPAINDIDGDGRTDVITPLDREGLTNDQIVIFRRP